MTLRPFPFGRRRKPATPPTPKLHPAPEPVQRTDESDALARELLAAFQQELADQPVGTELRREMTDEQMNKGVHPTELSFSLMMLCGDYSLRFDILALGVISCTKR